MTWNMKVTKTPQRCAFPQSSCSTSSSLGADPPSDLDTDLDPGDCSDLRIRKKQTNISVDAILLTM